MSNSASTPVICQHRYHFSTFGSARVSKAAGYATAARERPDPNAVCFVYALGNLFADIET